LNIECALAKSSKEHTGLFRIFTSDSFLKWPLQNNESKYRADIDGLRAVAVLSVMAFHMDLKGFTGGFVGVDVFFVISGYLISRIVFSEISQGTYSITSFYERRIRRIFPALFAMLLIFTACALFYMFASEMLNYAKSLSAAALSVSNFYFWQHSGYFDSPTSNPLLHTWSLAVEEQFYIFFPLYLWLVRRYYPQHLRLSVLLLVIASFLSSVIIVPYSPETAFYMPYTRAWELLVGTLLALGMVPHLSQLVLRNFAALGGIAMILVAVVAYRHSTPFPGLAALLPCLGAALIIHAGGSGPTVIGKLLSWRPFVFIGLISYSLYLWHWPVILLHKTGLVLGMSTMPSFLVTHLLPRRYDEIVEVAVSFALAVLSWKFIENPFRSGRLRLSGRPLFLISAGTAAVCVGFAVIAIASGGIQGRMAPDAERVASYRFSSARQASRLGSCFLTPDFSMKDFDYGQCMHIENNRKNFLLFGDSHAASVWPGVVTALAPANVLQSNVSSCKPLLHESGTAICRQMINYVFQDFLTNNKIDGLLLQGRWEAKDIDGLDETIRWADQRGIRVILLGPYPEYDAPLPRLLAYSIAWHKPDYAAQHLMSEPLKIDELLRRMAESRWHVPYVSLYQAICDRDSCKEYVDSGRTIPMLSDDHHISEPGSIYAMKTALIQAGFNGDESERHVADSLGRQPKS
jgi:peptidoglycan/LPS O-acetylase OafA/YrhL